MTGLVKKVRSKIDQRCLVMNMRKSGCKVSMKNAPISKLIIDFDKPGSPLGKHQRRCDYLFVSDGKNNNPNWIVPLELKRSNFDAHSVVEQLKAGAGAGAGEYLVPQNTIIKFRPVVVSNNAHKAERTKLKKQCNQIRFHNHAEYVRLISCGKPLTDVLR